MNTKYLAGLGLVLGAALGSIFLSMTKVEDGNRPTSSTASRINTVSVTPAIARPDEGVPPPNPHQPQEDKMREVVHSFLNYGTAHSRTVGEMLVYEQIAQSVEGHEAQFYMALKTLFERRQTITLGELRMAAGLSPVIAFTSPRLPRTYASPTEIGSAASRSSITPRGNTLNDLQTALMATRSGPNPSTSRYDEHRSSARTGMPLTSVEGGYVGDKGQFYVPGGSDGAINAKTGQFEPFEYTGR